MSRPDFSVAQAFSAGVGVFERTFRSVLAWGGVTFAASLAPALLIFFVRGGRLSVPDGGLTLDAFKSADPGVLINQFHGLSPGFLAYDVAAVAWAFFWSAVVDAAVYRSVLEPRGGRFAYLRVGPTELWLFLLMIVELLGLILVGVLWYALAIVSLLVAKIAGPPAQAWIGGVGIAAATVFSLWIVLRFSLAGAMTVGQGRFRLFGAWTLSKGRSWKLFWSFFLMVALARGLELFSAAAIKALDAFALQPAPAFLTVFELVWLAVVSLVVACLRTLALAPLATAYRSLSGAAD